MFLSWWRKRRRRKIVAQPFPAAWRKMLERDLPQFSKMPQEHREQLARLVQIFVQEQTWEGVGLDVTDAMKVHIAGYACLLLLGIEHDYFRNVTSIIIYPRAFGSLVPEGDTSDLVVEHDTQMLGEAWYQGPVTLSWEEVRRRRVDRHDGRNLVIHEFAHKLDMLDDWVNGTPPMSDAEADRAWARVMTDEYNALRDAAERGRRTLLDNYGATNEGEFFAVCAECFFEKPGAMKHRHPELYAVLSDYFKQDPANWYDS